MSNSNMDFMKTGLTLVNHTNIDNYKNQYVIVHGKVQSINNNLMKIINIFNSFQRSI